MEFDLPTITPIAVIRTDFPSKFGVPRQSGRVPSLKGEIVFTPKYRNPDALRGIEEFSHLWLIWQFSQTVQKGWSPTVRPPRLGGNVKKGVFATRSPFRPNPLGLSVVRLEEVRQTKNGPVLIVSGADLVDKTPIYDIKPYLPQTDAIPDALGGFSQADDVQSHALTVNFPPELLSKLPKDTRETAIAVLKEDPRPSYQNDPARVYGFPFAGSEIRFRVEGQILTVCEVSDAGSYPG